METQTKSVFQSKTMWVAAALALLGILEATVGFLETAGIEGQVTAIIGFIMMVLRWVTGQPVSMTGEGTKDVSGG